MLVQTFAPTTTACIWCFIAGMAVIVVLGAVLVYLTRNGEDYEDDE